MPFVNQEKKFWDACEQGDIKAAKKLMKKFFWRKPIDIDLAMQVAVSERNEKVIRSLMLLGADIDRPFVYSKDTEKSVNDGRIHFAAGDNDTDLIKLLLKYGTDVNKANKYGDTPMHIAATMGALESVKVLYAAGGDINRLNNRGDTPLHQSIHLGNEGFVKELVALGANVNKENKEGLTPLHIAILNNNAKMVKTLLVVGADANRMTNKMDSTLLHQAIQVENLEIIKLLIKAGTKVNRTDKYGWTPLHCAVYEKNMEMINLLLKSKAKVDCVDKDGCSPLYMAADRGHLEIMRILLEAGADVNKVNNNGWTPLYAVAIQADIHNKCHIFKNGQMIKDDAANDEKHQEKFNNYLKIMKLLLEYGADKNIPEKYGQTPMDYASSQVMDLLKNTPPKKRVVKKIPIEKDHIEASIVFHNAQKVREDDVVWRFVHTRA